MPLPTQAFAFSGGCKCGAIRYSVDVPKLSDRKAHPWSGGEENLPFVVICHCNDCRLASANLTLAGFCTPIEAVKFSLLSRHDPDQTDRPAWVPATAIFQPQTPPPDSFLTAYRCTTKVTRSFCARCGTQLAYSHYPLPEPWAPMLDLMLGTVDRQDLVEHCLKPDRHVWWDKGIDWIHGLYKDGPDGLPRHPAADITKIAS